MSRHSPTCAQTHYGPWLECTCGITEGQRVHPVNDVLPLEKRKGDQNLPTVNTHPTIQDLVVADILTRLAVDIQRYGTPLQGFNGRDVLRDAYEGVLDTCMYLRELLYERDNPEVSFK